MVMFDDDDEEEEQTDKLTGKINRTRGLIDMTALNNCK